MTRRRGRRRCARVVPSAAALALTTPLVLWPAAAGHAERPYATDPAAPPVTVALAELTPVAPRAADTLTVRGTLRNTGGAALSAVSVRLRVATRALANRSDIASVSAGEVRPTDPVPGTEQQLTPSLAPGAEVPWALAVPVRSLKLPGNGVYVVQAEVTAGQSPLGSVTTFLPFLPRRKLYDPTRVSWLWPLAAEPSRDARGAFTDDTLARDLAPGGRLAGLADAPGDVPVTWMIDPELLESVAALKDTHLVRDGKKTTRVAGDPNAARWLAALRARLAGQPVAALPYADPDVVGLTRHDATDRITAAVVRSRSTTAALLGRTSDTALAWPPDGLADERTLGALRAAGATAAVLSSATVNATAPLTYTPTGRATVGAEGERMQALLADEALGEALAGDLSAPGAAQLATQRFLADTAMLTLERPNEQRTVLVTPPRRWAPPAEWAAGLLGASGAVPWLTTVGLATMSRTVEAPELAGAVVAYPLQETRPRELGGPFVRRIRAAAEAADAVSDILAQPGALGQAYQGAALRAASSVWRDERDRGRAYVEDIREVLRAEAAKVKVIGRALVTLSSNHGTVPVTISNGLSRAVTVRLRLEPKVGSRLRVTPPLEPVTIGPGRKSTVRVEAEASTNGITRVAVSLQSASGRTFGSPIDLRVNTTSYGNVGLVVIGGAVGVLFVAAGARNVRRIRAARDSSRAVTAAGDAQDGAPGLPVDETVQA